MDCGEPTAIARGYWEASDIRMLSESPRTASGSNETTNSALKGLVGSVLAGRFRSWRGKSGQRYVFSIYPDIESTDTTYPRYDEAVVIAAEPLRDGTSRLVAIAETGHCPDLFFDGAMLAKARSNGATEIHVYLMAGNAAERAAIIADLRPGG